MEKTTEPEESVRPYFSIRRQNILGKADTPSYRKIKIVFNGPGTKSFEMPTALLTKVSTYFRDVVPDETFSDDASDDDASFDVVFSEETSETWDLCFGDPRSFAPPASEYELWLRFNRWLRNKCHINFALALKPDGKDDAEAQREEGVESLIYFVWFGIKYGIEEYQAQVLKALRKDASWKVSEKSVRQVWEKTPKNHPLREIFIKRAHSNLNDGVLSKTQIKTFAIPEFQKAFARALVESNNVESINHKSVPLRREDELEKARNQWKAKMLNPRAFDIIHVDIEELEAKWAASKEAERLRVAAGGKQKVEARDRGGHSQFSEGP